LAWAIRRIKIKNCLTAEDAVGVERAFQDRLRVLMPDDYPETSQAESPESFGSAGESHKSTGPNGARKSSREAAALPLLKPRRARDKDHLRFIAIQPCTVCGRQPCEAHHIRYAQPRALGRRVSDEFTVPLCRVHHRELHQLGDERVWWSKFNIDPMPIALKYWQHSRGIPVNQQNNPGPRDAAAEPERSLLITPSPDQAASSSSIVEGKVATL
jgi:hypothetical protein